MKLISEQEKEQMINEELEELRKIIEEGGKVTDTIIREKGKITTTRKIEPVNGEATSSTIVQTKDEFIINSL